jgi:hypothetical protein
MRTEDEQMFVDLHRHHLRHPGSVPAAIVQMMKRNTFTYEQINKVRLEWLRLGLNKEKP